MDCATHSGVTAISACTRCERPICSACRETLDGHDYCAACVTELQASLATPAAVAATAPAHLSGDPIVADRGFPLKGVLLAALAGVVGAFVWYGVVELTNMKIGLVAVGIGWLVGRAAVMGAGAGGKQLAVFSLIIAVVSMVLGEYLMLNHAVHAYFAKEESGAVLPALLSPAALLPVYAESFGVMSIVFYAIGAWEAFRFPWKAQTPA